MGTKWESLWIFPLQGNSYVAAVTKFHKLGGFMHIELSTCGFQLSHIRVSIELAS